MAFETARERGSGTLGRGGRPPARSTGRRWPTWNDLAGAHRYPRPGTPPLGRRLPVGGVRGAPERPTPRCTGSRPALPRSRRRRSRSEPRAARSPRLSGRWRGRADRSRRSRGSACGRATVFDGWRRRSEDASRAADVRGVHERPGRARPRAVTHRAWLVRPGECRPGTRSRRAWTRWRRWPADSRQHECLPAVRSVAHGQRGVVRGAHERLRAVRSVLHGRRGAVGATLARLRVVRSVVHGRRDFVRAVAGAHRLARTLL